LPPQKNSWGKTRLQSHHQKSLAESTYRCPYIAKPAQTRNIRPRILASQTEMNQLSTNQNKYEIYCQTLFLCERLVLIVSKNHSIFNHIKKILVTIFPFILPPLF
jgi:hypothetical protein